MAERGAGERPPSSEQRFARLGQARRIWAVGAVHGEAQLLARLHAALGERWQPLDRLVYLGNMIGRGQAVLATMDELLAFRRRVLAVQHAIPEDIVYLRGSQEEMWQKLLQLQFATDPHGVLRWMLGNGVDATLTAYGGNVGDALGASRHGPLALTRWTQRLRQNVHAHLGHFQVLSELRRAAFTSDSAFLFVHAGLDPSRPLEAQSDSFWWGHPDFAALAEPYLGYGLVVRGYDARHPGIQAGERIVTLDGGAGFGGALVAACLEPGRGVTERIEVGS
jgi:serine/threonine protein phosphatase 1